jgi:prephenate dehydratase
MATPKTNDAASKDAPTEVAYLGPMGTYAHLVAEKRYGTKCRMLPFPTIHEVCRFAARHAYRRGIVPIENSSGGAIYETVDILLAGKPRFTVEEELVLNVKLALIGHKGQPIRNLYSHFAPLEHCEGWIRKALPHVQPEVTGSTAAAALQAASHPESAALGSRRLARLYNLDILEYPIEADVPNITTFLAISGSKQPPAKSDKTTLAARTPNQPGGLCSFLETFRDEKVNLSRILSRPIRGCHREYAFLVDIEGGMDRPNVARSVAASRKICVDLRVVGSYPTHRPYSS